jgi:hypothetical protein
MGLRRKCFRNDRLAFGCSGHPDLDQIAILQAEPISQIHVRDDLDHPGVSSIPCRSHRRPQERPSMIETHQLAGKQQYVLARRRTLLGRTESREFVARVKPIKHEI